MREYHRGKWLAILKQLHRLHGEGDFEKKLKNYEHTNPLDAGRQCILCTENRKRKGPEVQGCLVCLKKKKNKTEKLGGAAGGKQMIRDQQEIQLEKKWDPYLDTRGNHIGQGLIRQ